ncbi:hypothetical protein [Lentzea terrae]|uniref:hypothetical protein n=1 Tax=Lentzea terrae TaxID=2200761 RepID=UPI0013004A79|nr:hypothetical protein [Lentzea terrae]
MSRAWLAYAERLANTAAEDQVRAWWLGRMARTACDVGEVDVARRLVSEAQMIADAVEESDVRDWILAPVADAAIGLGDLELAESLLQKIERDWERRKVLWSIARSDVASAAGFALPGC